MFAQIIQYHLDNLWCNICDTVYYCVTRCRRDKEASPNWC